MGIVAQAALGFGQRHLLHGLEHAFTHLPARQAGMVGAHRLGYLLAHAHDGVERGHGLLEDHGDVAAADGADLSGGEGGEIAGVEEDVAGDGGVGSEQAEDGEGGGGFAGAGFADEGEGFAGSDGEADAVHHFAGGCFRLAEGDGEIADVEQRGHKDRVQGALRGRRIASRGVPYNFRMASHLDKIVAHTREVVAQRKAAADIAALERRAREHEPRGFARALKACAMTGPAVIAELKKASPSRGMIRENLDVAALAKELEAAGAAALSVLTEEKFFLGSLGNLERASASTEIPCLRKDFMVDEFQMLEARAHGADAILLIAASLSDAELVRLRDAARAMELDTLCEVHNREELERVVDLGCDAYGVNARNLKTFDVSLDVTLELVAMLPKDKVRVAESGIHTAADVQRLRAAGYDAFLVGESLMRQASPGDALRALLDKPQAPLAEPARA